MKFLYARVSTSDGSQNIDRQIINKDEYDEIFEDYASGSSINRPKLQELLKWVRKGDVIEVHSIDRLARNVNDLLNIVKIITEERKAEIYFIKENLRFSDDNVNNPFSKLTLQVIGSMAEFERNMIRNRQREGIAIAKAKGVYSKERSKKLSLTKIEAVKKDLENKVKIKDICRKYGISERTFYRYRKNGML